MWNKLVFAGLVVCVSLVAGCASVDWAEEERDSALKAFPAPAPGMAGLYLYRDTPLGFALKKKIYVDGVCLGRTKNKTFYYKEVTPGQHEVSTESEFSDNKMTVQTEAGRNHFVEQFITMGVFVGQAYLKIVSEEEGMQHVRNCRLAE